MSIQAVDVAVHLEPWSAREPAWVDAWPGDGDHPQRRELPLGQRVCGDDLVEERPPDATAADGNDAHQLIRLVTELGAPCRHLLRRGRREPGDVAREREVLLGPVADRRQLTAEPIRHDVIGLADEDRPIADPRVPSDVLDHLRVVVRREIGLSRSTVGHRQEADEVGQPHVLAALELGVLVPEVVHVPRLVADHDVVQALLDDLLEEHEVGQQDLVHVAQRLEAVQVVLAGLRGHVRRLVGQPPAGRMDLLALRFEHRRDRMLGEPVDLYVRTELLELLGDGDITTGVSQPDRRRQVERPLRPAESACPHLGLHLHSCCLLDEVEDQMVDPRADRRTA